MRKSVLGCFLIAGALALTACSAPMEAITDMVRFRSGATQKSIAERKLDPNYQYLMVTLRGRTFLMAKGAEDSAAQGNVEVYYSGEGDVLRLLNGRVVGASGTPVTWSSVRLEGAPDWRTVVNSPGPLTYTRRRDVMPGYQFGVVDDLTVARAASGSHGRFFGAVPAGVEWFTETTTGSSPLPQVRYAVLKSASGGEKVIYGEQCLADNFCFSWQRWPTPQS